MGVSAKLRVYFSFSLPCKLLVKTPSSRVFLFVFVNIKIEWMPGKGLGGLIISEYMCITVVAFYHVTLKSYL